MTNLLQIALKYQPQFCQNLSKSRQNLAKFPWIFASNIAFFSIFQNLQVPVKICKKSANVCKNFTDFWKNCKILQNLSKSVKIFADFFCRNLQNLLARRWFSCRFWKVLKKAYLDAKIGVDPAENEPSKVSAPKLSVLRQYTESRLLPAMWRRSQTRRTHSSSIPPLEHRWGLDMKIKYLGGIENLKIKSAIFSFKFLKISLRFQFFLY